MHQLQLKRSLWIMAPKRQASSLEFWQLSAVRLLLCAVLVLVSMVIGTTIGYEFRGQEIEEVRYESSKLSEALESVGQLNEEEYEAHREATATALLLTDAYLAGGLDKAGEIMNAVEESAVLASEKRDAINEILLKFGFAPEATTIEN